MDWKHVPPAVGEALRDGLGRLIEIAPEKIVVLTEDSDWGLVGGDLRDAAESVAEPVQAESTDDKELVEA